MADDPLKITDEGSLHKYFAAIPHTLVRGLKSRGLSVDAKWLYVYLKSVAGAQGVCRQSTSTIVAASGLSRGQVSRERQTLSKAGLIRIQSSKRPNRDPDHIFIIDIWPQNMSEFCVPPWNTSSISETHIQSGDEHSGVPGGNSGVPGGNSGVPGGNSGVPTDLYGRARGRKTLLRKTHEEEDNTPLSFASLSPPHTEQRVPVEWMADHPTKQPRKTHTTLRTDYTPGFLHWWDTYPIDRRRAKPACFAVWLAHGLESRAEELIQKLERLSETLWKNIDDRKYIKTSLPYLNAGQWDDDLIPLPSRTDVLMARLSEKERRMVEATQRILAEDAPHGYPGQNRVLQLSE